MIQITKIKNESGNITTNLTDEKISRNMQTNKTESRKNRKSTQTYNK